MGRRSNPPLTRQRILEAAVALADREGLEAVSVRRLARQLCVDPMSLYNHVDSKEAILDGIVELLMREADLPVEPMEWDAWARFTAHRFAELAARHPRAFAVFSLRPLMAPESIRPVEAFLAALARAGFTTERSSEILVAFFGYVVGFSMLRHARSLFTEAEPSATDMSRLSPEEFPRCHQLATLPQPEEEVVFDASLQALLEGMRAILSADVRTTRVARTREATA